MQAQDWEYVNTIHIDNTEWANKVYAKGNNEVFIVGSKGLIVKSTDRALAWTKQYFPTQVTLNDIIFCNDDIGFIVGNKGTILKTEDGGTNWIQLNSGTVSDINAIAATGLDNIWVVGNGGLVLFSTDAGSTWSAKNIPNNRNLYDIKFRENIGYIVGDGNNVLKTVNGGIGWETQIAYNNPNEDDIIFSLSITENKVFALVNGAINYDLGVILSATHSSSWNLVNGEGIYNCKAGIYFQNDNSGFVASVAWTTGGGWGLWISKTIDSGDTWEEMNIGAFWKYLGSINNKGNFSFSENNEYGYFLSGQVLLRIPYTGEFEGSGLDKIESDNSKISIKYGNNELWINSSKTISTAGIISITGTKVKQKNNIRTEEFSMNVADLPKGMYLIRTVFTDKTSEIVKWIK